MAQYRPSAISLGRATTRPVRVTAVPESETVRRSTCYAKAIGSIPEALQKDFLTGQGKSSYPLKMRTCT
eukprot:1419527-Prymnesium_polylepis.2